MGEPKFTHAQAERLRSLGVLDPQLRRLEAAIPLCRSLLLRPAPLSDVRNELSLVRGRLEAAQTSLRRLLAPPAELEALSEVRARIDVARAGDTARAEDQFNDLLRLLSSVLARVEKAGADLPSQQRRHRSADTTPIAIVDDALTEGWGEAYYQVAESDEEMPVRDVPPYPFAASTGSTSKFRAVVSICYETFRGISEADPERALKAYVAMKRRWFQDMVTSAGH